MNDSSSETEENFDDEFDKNKTISRLDNTALQSTSAATQPINVFPKDDNDLISELKFLRDQMAVLQKNSFENLTRLAVIEESLLRSGNLITVKKEDSHRAH